MRIIKAETKTVKSTILPVQGQYVVTHNDLIQPLLRLCKVNVDVNSFLCLSTTPRKRMGDGGEASHILNL